MGGFNSNLGSVYVEVGADLSALSKDLQGAISDATQAGQQIGTALESGVTQGSGPAQESLRELGGAATEASGNFGELGASLEEVAGLFGAGLGIAEGIESLKSLAEESIDAYGKIQLATVALTALTGSAETAEETLSAMKGLALGSIFSLPELDTAAQKMAAIGVAAGSIPPAMQAVIAAAEGTGNSLDAVASSLDRIYLSATIQPRTLATLGISMQDLADTMGVSADKVTETFKALGPQSDDALQILTATINARMGDAAAAVVGTLPNAINQVKVQWDSLLESLGGAAAGPLTSFLTQLNELIASITALGEALKSIGGAGGIISSLLPQFDLVAGAWSKLKDVFEGSAAAIDVATGKYPSFQAAIAALDTQIQGVTASTKDGTQASTDKAKADQDAKDKTDAAAQAARDALAAEQNLTAVKALRTKATTDVNEAESELAQAAHALHIPAIEDMDTAEQGLVSARQQVIDSTAKVQSAESDLQAILAQSVPNATQLKAAEDNLDSARKQLKTDIGDLKEAEQDLTLSKAAAQKASDLLTASDKDYADAMKTIAGPAVVDYATALYNVDTAKLTLKTDADNLKAAEQALADLMGGDGVKSADDIKDAEGRISTARAQLKTDTSALKDAETSLKQVRDDAQKVNAALIQGEKDLDGAYTKFTPHLTDLSTAMGKVQDAQGKLITAEGNEKTALDALQKLKDAGITQGQAVTDALATQKQAHEDLTGAEKDLSDAEQQLQTDWGISAQAIQFILDPLRNLTPAAQQAEAALVSMGITPQAKIQELADKAASAYQTILDAGTSTPQEVLQAHIAALQAEIAAYTASGTDVPAAQQIMLAKLQQQEKDYVTNSTQRWTALYGQIHDTVANMFSGLVTDLFEGGDFLGTITKAFEKIGEDMLNTVLKPFESAFEDWISSTLTNLLKSAFGGALGGLGQSAGGILGTGLGAVDTAGNSPAGVGGAITDITDTGGGAASSAASGIGSALSSVSGIVTAVSSSISAVTGLLSMFGVGNSGDQLDRLNGIDNATTYLAWVFSAGGLHDAALNTENTLNNLFQAFTTWNRDLMNEISNDLDGINNRLQIYAESTFPNFAAAVLAGGLAISGVPAVASPTPTDTTPTTQTAPAPTPTADPVQAMLSHLTLQEQSLKDTFLKLQDSIAQNSQQLSTDLANKSDQTSLVADLQSQLVDLTTSLATTTDPAKRQELQDQLTTVQQKIVQAQSNLNDVQQSIAQDLQGQTDLKKQIDDTQSQIEDLIAQIAKVNAVTPSTTTPTVPTSGGAATKVQPKVLTTFSFVDLPSGHDLAAFGPRLGGAADSLRNAANSLIGAPAPSTSSATDITTAIRSGLANAKFVVTLNGQEMLMSNVQYYEDNGLVIPQS